MSKNFAPTLRKVDWFFIVFIPEIFPENLLWTGTMQSWQPCPNYLVQNFVIFLSNSWENFVFPKFSRKSFHDTFNAVLTSLSTHFRSNSVKQIDSLFSNFLRQKVLPRAKKTKCYKSKKSIQFSYFSSKFFPRNRSTGHLECSFDNCEENFSINFWMFFARVPEKCLKFIEIFRRDACLDR